MTDSGRPWGEPEVRTYLAAAHAQLQLPGLAVGVVRQGRPAERIVLGQASLAAGRPMTEDTVLPIASVTKTLTAVAFLQLVADGRVGLDDPVAPLLRDVRLRQRRGGPSITPRMLLTHTSGIPQVLGVRDLVQPLRRVAITAGRPVLSNAQLYRRPVRQAGRAGQVFSYTNHGSAMLAEIVETVTGRSFAEQLQERVLDPVGASSTALGLPSRLQARSADLYAMTDSGPVLETARTLVPAVGGGAHSTLTDLMRYAAALRTTTSGGLLPPELLTEAFSPTSRSNEHLHTGMGLGFMVNELGGRSIAGHGGSWFGAVSSLLVDPAADVAVVLLTNCDLVTAQRLAEGVLRGVVGVGQPTSTDTPGPRVPAGWYAPVGHPRQHYFTYRDLGPLLRVPRSAGRTTSLVGWRGLLAGRHGLTGDPADPIRGTFSAGDPRFPTTVEVVVEERDRGTRLHLGNPLRLQYRRLSPVSGFGRRSAA